MTRQAEPLTVEMDGGDRVWCFDRIVLSRSESRIVRPEGFRQWVADTWLSRHAGRVSRALRMTSHPMSISTALHVAVRLGWDDGQVRRRWVAFSAVEGWLRDIEMPGATVDPSPLDHCVAFRFPRDEPALVLENEPLVFRCEGDGVHWYRDRDDRGRRLSEVA